MSFILCFLLLGNSSLNFFRGQKSVLLLEPVKMFYNRGPVTINLSIFLGSKSENMFKCGHKIKRCLPKTIANYA